jgi:hypothetical protein
VRAGPLSLSPNHSDDDERARMRRNCLTVRVTVGFQGECDAHSKGARSRLGHFLPVLVSSTKTEKVPLPKQHTIRPAWILSFLIVPF